MCNIRSLRNKIDEVICLVEEVRPHLLALTETWLTTSIFDGEIMILGYNILRSDRLHARGGGGVALYYASDLSVELLETVSSSDGLEECLVCRVKSFSKSSIVGVFYRSPGSSGQLTLQKLEQWSKRNACLFMGDFNAPDIDWSTLSCHSSVDSFDNQLLEWSLRANLHQHVMEPTRRIPGQTFNVLDLVFSRCPSDLSHVDYLPPVGTSDHVTVSFFWQGCEPAYFYPITRRNIWRTDFDSLREAAARMDWMIPNHINTEAAWATVYINLLSLVDRFVPVTKRRPLSWGPPWIDKHLRSLFKKRKRLWNKFKFSGSSTDYELYKTCRNHCTALKLEKRVAFETHLAKSSKTNPKPLFGYIKRRTKGGSGIPALESPDAGCLAEEDGCKASILLNQYSSVFTSESLTLPEFPNSSSSTIEDFNFSDNDVFTVLSNLKISSSPGPDNLHPLLLRNLADIIATPVAQVFRRSLDEGCLPRLWKSGTIKPIFKGGARHSAANYRPITLTSVLCKCFERLLKKAIQGHFERLSLISPSQHGFQKNRSCVTNLLVARESWVNLLDEGAYLDVVFIDFSKAFDKVPHRRLTMKLEGYGIRGKLLAWITDFLTDRSFSVKVNDAFSNVATCMSGVPQGSVLGPELFKIYINDLPETIGSNCLLYADDLKLWAPVSSVEEAGALQGVLDTLHEWSLKWQLPINFDKCSVLPLASSTPLLSYQIGGHPLRVTSSERDLGVMISSDLKSHADTTRKVGSATRFLGAIRRAFSRLTPELFRTLFCSHVRPILEYGQPAVYPLPAGESELIERVQRRGSKSVFGLRHLSYEQRLQRLGMFS